MIIGLGNDVCFVPRIRALLARFGVRFTARVYSSAECKHADSNEAMREMRYAQMFAAKEACAKALGTGIAGGVFLRHIEVLRQAGGKPYLCLQGGAYEALRGVSRLACGDSGMESFTTRTHLTLSGDGNIANAVVVLEIV